MEVFCLARGLAVDEWVSEIGGGMNLRREKFLAVMDAVESGDVATLVVAHKDRLVRFGFDYIEHVAGCNDCQIIVANQESLSPQQELVEDLLAIVHMFSCRLYGLRRYEKALKDELTGRVRSGMKVTRIAYSHRLNAGKYAALVEQARRLGRVRSMVWQRYGSIAGAGLRDRQVRDAWLADGTYQRFGVLATRAQIAATAYAAVGSVVGRTHLQADLSAVVVGTPAPTLAALLDSDSRPRDPWDGVGLAVQSRHCPPSAGPWSARR